MPCHPDIGIHFCDLGNQICESVSRGFGSSCCWRRACL